MAALLSSHDCLCPGYPRLLSGDMLVPKTMATMQKDTLFPGDPNTAFNYNATTFRRHFLSFAQYPFRNLCPREAHRLLGPNYNEFDGNSPIFPAHTQLNIKFKRRPVAELINYILPSNLNFDRGASQATLTQDDRNGALEFSVTTRNAAGDADVLTNYRITAVQVIINDMYLQVWSLWGQIVVFFSPLFCLGDPSSLQKHQSGTSP